MSGVVSVSLAVTWRWRCEAERILVPGSDLRIVDPCDGGVSLLTESGLPEVARDYLRPQVRRPCRRSSADRVARSGPDDGLRSGRTSDGARLDRLPTHGNRALLRTGFMLH